MIAMSALVAILIVTGVAIAAFRVLRSGHRWRWPLALGQILAGALLYVFLFPPQAVESGGSLTILTPGINSEQLANAGTGAGVIALPGIASKVDGRVERAPDLATALRRHPQTSRLRVVGNGLPLRDRAIARGLEVELDAAPLPDGIVGLSVPEQVQVGTRWRATGRIQSSVLANRVLELRDPADAVSASVKTDASGRFNVEGVANASGLLRYSLSLRDDDGKDIDTVPLAIDARAGAPLRLLIAAAVPSAELKYLRRWATDAGQMVDARVGLSEGIALRDGEKPLIDAASLAASELLIVDERSWAAFDASTRELVGTAVDGGMGLLLRVTAPMTDEAIKALAQLGLTMTSVDPAPPSALRNDTRDDALPLNHLPYRLDRSLAPLTVLRGGAVVAAWRVQGRGRIGAITLADSYRYVLAGAPDRHGSLWANITSALARARGDSQPRLPNFARVGERAVICGLDGNGWQVDDAKSARTALLVDDDSSGCAAYWPAIAGTHQLSKTLGDSALAWSFDVLADDQATSLLAAHTQQTTRDLATTSTNAVVTSERLAKIPRMAWLFAWLMVMTLLWWVERRDHQANND